MQYLLSLCSEDRSLVLELQTEKKILKHLLDQLQKLSLQSNNVFLQVKEKNPYLLNDLRGHSHLFTNLHRLSTSTLEKKNKAELKIFRSNYSQKTSLCIIHGVIRAGNQNTHCCTWLGGRDCLRGNQSSLRFKRGESCKEETEPIRKTQSHVCVALEQTVDLLLINVVLCAIELE